MPDTAGPKIVIAGTREDWPGGAQTLTPRDPTREPNGRILWFGAALDADGSQQVWFRITAEAVGRMREKTPRAEVRIWRSRATFLGLRRRRELVARAEDDGGPGPPPPPDSPPRPRSPGSCAGEQLGRGHQHDARSGGRTARLPRRSGRGPRRGRGLLPARPRWHTATRRCPSCAANSAIRPVTLYRHVGPRGQLREQGQKGAR